MTNSFSFDEKKKILNYLQSLDLYVNYPVCSVDKNSNLQNLVNKSYNYYFVSWTPFKKFLFFAKDNLAGLIDIECLPEDTTDFKTILFEEFEQLAMIPIDIDLFDFDIRFGSVAYGELVSDRFEITNLFYLKGYSSNHHDIDLFVSDCNVGNSGIGGSGITFYSRKLYQLDQLESLIELEQPESVLFFDSDRNYYIWDLPIEPRELTELIESPQEPTELPQELPQESPQELPQEFPQELIQTQRDTAPRFKQMKKQFHKKEFWLQETNLPGIYNLYDNENKHHGMANVGSSECEEFVLKQFENIQKEDSFRKIKIECISMGNGWTPVPF